MLLTCALARAAALAWFPPELTRHYYWDTSDKFFARRTFALPDADAAFLEPLYPALLAALRWLTGDRAALVMLAQAMLGAAAGLVLFRLTTRLTGSRAAAWTAATLYALDPYLVRQAVAPVEITLATALLIAAASQFDRSESPRHATAAGVLVGLVGLTRFSLLPVGAGAAALLLWTGRAKQAAIFTAAAAVTLAPWMTWTYSKSGALVPTRAGVNLFVSTNEYAAQVVPSRNADLLVPYAYEVAARHIDRTALPAAERQRREDEVLFRLAVRFARERPAETVKLKLKNLAYAVSPLLLPFDRKPQEASARIEGGRVIASGLERRPVYEHIAYTASRTLLLAGAVVGLVVRKKWRLGDGFLVLVAAAVIGVQTVFFPTSRLLAPMAFVMMFYTAVAATSRHTSRGLGTTARRDDDTTQH